MNTHTIKITTRQRVGSRLTARRPRPGSERAATHDTPDAWFTLQSETGQDSASRPLTPPGARLETVKSDPASETAGVQANHANPHPAATPVRWLRSRWRAGLVTIAAIAIVATTAVLLQARHPGHGRRLLAAQRAELSRLIDQRNQALTAAGQAQQREAAWRAQATRWRSRALTRRRPRHSDLNGTPTRRHHSTGGPGRVSESGAQRDDTSAVAPDEAGRNEHLNANCIVSKPGDGWPLMAQTLTETKSRSGSTGGRRGCRLRLGRQ
jgi:hypothetical protein